jgi:hypothetical protein
VAVFVGGPVVFVAVARLLLNAPAERPVRLQRGARRERLVARVLEARREHRAAVLHSQQRQLLGQRTRGGGHVRSGGARKRRVRQ